MLTLSIEDYPFIIRFKTTGRFWEKAFIRDGIEDYPFIIRFKTLNIIKDDPDLFLVLRTIHL